LSWAIFSLLVALMLRSEGFLLGGQEALKRLFYLLDYFKFLGGLEQLLRGQWKQLLQFLLLYSHFWRYNHDSVLFSLLLA
jgi:hypothetical protein